MAVVQLTMRAAGLITKEIPTVVLRLAANHTTAQLQVMTTGVKKKQALLALEHKQLVQYIMAQNLCGGKTVDAEFVSKVLGNQGPGLRTDSKTVMAFTLDDSRNFKLVGVASYGASDSLDTEDRLVRFPGDNTTTALLHKGHLVELDLVCAKGAPAGAGTLLVAFCMAKAAKQKSRGSYKYKGCVMTLANKVQMPHITARLGFLPPKLITIEA
jgi:hypothetical protein